MRFLGLLCAALVLSACTSGTDDTAITTDDTGYAGMRVRKADAGWRMVAPLDAPSGDPRRR